jgi:hypothetical protein
LNEVLLKEVNLSRITLEKISQSLSIPFEGVHKSFSELKKHGWIFTKAKNPEDVFGKFPVRLAFQPPFKNAKPSSLSFGPFCLDKKLYEVLFSKAKEELGEEAWKLLIAFQRIQYEKLGVIVDGYSFSLPDELMAIMLSLIDCWDLENPVVFDSLVWIVPNDKAKEYAEKVAEKSFSENDFGWWNVLIDFGEDFIPTLPSDYPNTFIYVPDTIRHWQRYTPVGFIILFYDLCHKLKAEGEFEYQTVKSSSQLISLIDEITKELEETAQSEESYSLDRKVLIKELYDFNSFAYPFDATSTFDFLLQIGFLKMKKRGAEIEYQINKKPPHPKRIIKFPQNWEKRMNEFLKTGSILFAYLSVEEILSK